ncbi:MAG TPA: hypothetical protein VE093_14495 [Polyangiaceae bacterium]|nr:hypothetical protein [Polyangiaceae bacterium]
MKSSEPTGCRPCGLGGGRWFSGGVAMRLTLAAGVLAATLSAGAEAKAQSKEDLAKARELFQEGIALAAGNNCSGAISKYKEVARLVRMTPQVAFNIAECEERLGKLVSALGNFRLAQSQLEDPKARAKAKDVASQVDARVTSLEERIPKLTVKRGKGAERAVLTLDGTELGSTQIGAEMTVDPGPHELVARIGEKEASRKAFTIGEKEAQEVEIEVDLEAMRRAEKPVETAKPAETAAPQLPQPDTGGSKAPGVVVASAGFASAVVGLLLFAGPRQSTIDELEAVCGPDKRCPASAEQTALKGRLYTGIAEAAWGVGGAAIIVGTIMIIASGGDGEKKAPDQAALAVPGTQGRVRWIGAAPGADAGGVSLSGRF